MKFHFMIEFYSNEKQEMLIRLAGNIFPTEAFSPKIFRALIHSPHQPMYVIFLQKPLARLLLSYQEWQKKKRASH